MRQVQERRLAPRELEVPGQIRERAPGPIGPQRDARRLDSERLGAERELGTSRFATTGGFPRSQRIAHSSPFAGCPEPSGGRRVLCLSHSAADPSGALALR